eukprot:UN26712
MRYSGSDVFKGLTLFGEFKQMWNVGAELYKNKYIPVEGGKTPFSVIRNFKWSAMGQAVMSSFVEVHRRNTIRRVAKCYSSISDKELSQLLD